MDALCNALASTVSELRLNERFLWTAIRTATENRLRDELAYVRDAKCAADAFVAPEVLVGLRQHADIAELRHGRPAVVIELKLVWGADAIWKKGTQPRAEAAYPDVTPVLRAVVLYEGWRARSAAAELGVVLLEVVHIHTPTDRAFRKERGLALQAELSPSPDVTDSLLGSYLAALGQPCDPIILADHAVDSKTGVSFSIHAMFAPVTHQLRAPAAKSAALG